MFCIGIQDATEHKRDVNGQGGEGNRGLNTSAASSPPPLLKRTAYCNSRARTCPLALRSGISEFHGELQATS